MIGELVWAIMLGIIVLALAVVLSGWIDDHIE